jgi:hypothetical protein
MDPTVSVARCERRATFSRQVFSTSFLSTKTHVEIHRIFRGLSRQAEDSSITKCVECVDTHRREQARKFADAVSEEGIPQKQARWCKYKAWVRIAQAREADAKTEAEEAARAAEARSNELPALFGGGWTALTRGEQVRTHTRTRTDTVFVQVE